MLSIACDEYFTEAFSIRAFRQCFSKKQLKNTSWTKVARTQGSETGFGKLSAISAVTRRLSLPPPLCYLAQRSAIPPL